MKNGAESYAARAEDVDVCGHRWHYPEYVAAWFRDHTDLGHPEREAQRHRRFSSVSRCVRGHPAAPTEILELGVGWGRLTRHLLEVIPKARVTAIDFSRPMLDRAERNPPAA